MNIILILLMHLSMNVHDIQVAFYKISQDTEHVSIEFVIEKEDVEATFKELSINLTEDNMINYIEENFSISINGESKNLSFGTMKFEDKHICLFGKISAEKDPITSVQIQNTILLNIEDHSNIIEVNLHDQERGFLMNEDRTSIEFDY